MKKKGIYFSIIFLIITFFLIIHNFPHLDSAIGQLEKPIRIGFFSPETTASLFFYAPWSKQGFELGLSYATDNKNATITGRPYEIVYYDTKGLITDAISQAESAIKQDNIDILVGGTYSDVAGAIAEIAEKYQKLYFITPGADADLTGKHFNPYTFRIARNTWHDAYTGVNYAMDTLGAKSFSFLAADYTFGYTGVETMTKIITEKNGSVVLAQYASLATTDFTPYLNNILTTEESIGIDYLFIYWSGNFGYLWQDLGEKNVTGFMDVGGAVIDIYSMNVIEESILPPHTLIGSRGLCVYGYELADNPVNEWMVDQHIKRNIRPNSHFSGHTYRVPELFTASGFATAQFLVNVTNAIPDLDIYGMVNHLENNLTIETPKGPTFLRPEDHQALVEMYIAEVWYDNRSNSETKGFLIPKLVKKLDPLDVAPPIESNWIPGSLTRPKESYGLEVVIAFFGLLVISWGRNRHKQRKRQ